MDETDDAMTEGSMDPESRRQLHEAFDQARRELERFIRRMLRACRRIGRKRPELSELTERARWFLRHAGGRLGKRKLTESTWGAVVHALGVVFEADQKLDAAAELIREENRKRRRGRDFLIRDLETRIGVLNDLISVVEGRRPVSPFVYGDEPPTRCELSKIARALGRHILRRVRKSRQVEPSTWQAMEEAIRRAFIVERPGGLETWTRSVRRESAFNPKPN